MPTQQAPVEPGLGLCSEPHHAEAEKSPLQTDELTGPEQGRQPVPDRSTEVSRRLTVFVFG